MFSFFAMMRRIRPRAFAGKRVAITCCSALLSIASTGWAQDRPLQWVDNTGKYKVEAEFVRLDENQVVLKKPDGKELKIPFDRLSRESLSQAKSLGANANPNKSPGSSAAAPASGSPGGSDPIQIPLDTDAKQLVDLVMRELSKGNSIVLWDAMPREYQKDIESLVGSFAKRVDSRTFDMLRKTRNTLVDILKKQQKFILNSSVLPIPPNVAQEIDAAYPNGVAVMEAILSKDLFDGKRLQKGDLRSFIDTYLRNINSAGDTLAASLPSDNPFRIEYEKSKSLGVTTANYTVNQTSATQAEVQFEAPPQTPGATPPPIRLSMVDGRWLPSDLSRGWPQGMQQANAVVSMMKPDQIHQIVSGFLFVINAPLNNLKNSKTQEEFDRNLLELQDLLQKSAGALGPPGLGGPGGPPPGGFGQPGPPGQLGRGQPSPPPSGNGSNNGAGSTSVAD